MTGGISTPPVEAHVSMPAATVPFMPTLRMAGMVMTPVVSTLVTTLPLSEPIRPLDTIATLAGPPRTWPSNEKARLMKKRPAPVCSSAAPKTTKPKTRLANALMGMPRMLSCDIA